MNEFTSLSPYEPDLLPEGIRSRFVSVNGLRMHVLEAGFAEHAAEKPCVVLLHGFPELAYSWRHIMPALAEQGFHVIAPDQRGFGRTTGWAQGYDVDLQPFGIINLVTDVVALTAALGHRRVQAVVGHDSGSQVAAMAALIRPDIFRSLVMMSAPFPGVPALIPGAENSPAAFQDDPIHAGLRSLARPRKHYQMYYSSPEANADLCSPPEGLRSFLRAYFHHKSADWTPNRPHPLKDWSPEALAEMPTYYIMELDRGMPASVLPFAPSREEQAACGWLTERELGVYAAEYARTGFQGGLNWYRCGTTGLNAREMTLFAGRTIDVPALFIAGNSDWCPYQIPGYLDAMARQGCSDFRGCRFVEAAGHWVQQEQPQKTCGLLLEFLNA